MVHSQSSRSHAIMEMEILNDEVAKIREDINLLSAEQTYCAQNVGKFAVVYLGNGKKKEKYIGDSLIRNLKNKVEKAIVKSKALTRDNPYIGGTLTLCDLAGADKPTQLEYGADGKSLSSKQPKNIQWEGGEMITQAELEFRTSTKINEELFQLKEVIRLANDTTRSPPYRGSTLTKVLKRVLRPRMNFPNQVVMIANCSSSILEERESMNTLKYAQVLSGYEDDKAAADKAWRARDLKRQIRILYAERTDKKPDEVKKILERFKGRELMLMLKIMKKYPWTKLDKEEQAVEEKKEEPKKMEELKDAAPPEAQKAPEAAAPAAAPDSDDSSDGGEAIPELAPRDMILARSFSTGMQLKKANDALAADKEEA